MISPRDRSYDHQTFHKAATVVFEGYSLENDSHIWLQARNPSTLQWETFKDFTSAHMTWASYFGGYTWYYWTTTAVVPDKFWIPGAGGGWRAEVKSRYDSNGQEFMSVRDDFEQCMGEHFDEDDVNVIYQECRAPNSPSAWIVTNGEANFSYSETAFEECWDDRCSGSMTSCKEQCQDRWRDVGPLFPTSGFSYSAWYNVGNCFPSDCL